MATVDIVHAHELPIADARAKAEEVARGLEERLGIAWRWDADSIRFDAPSGVAKGARGEVRVGANEVRVLIDLPLMLRPMKGMIEAKVRDKLVRAMGA